jgi:hypothetical protein
MDKERHSTLKKVVFSFFQTGMKLASWVLEEETGVYLASWLKSRDQHMIKYYREVQQ